MNNISRLVLASCILSITMLSATVTILEKRLELCKDPKTEKMLVAQAYAFIEDSEKESPNLRWITVFPYENELLLFTTEKELQDVFPITRILSTQQAFDVKIDPSAENPFIMPTEKFNSNSNMASMHVTISQEVQIFKDLLILVARGNTKAITSLINKHSLKKINAIIDQAIDCQGTCYILPDDLYAFLALIQNKTTTANTINFTGSLVFIPIQSLLEAALAQEPQETNPALLPA